MAQLLTARGTGWRTRDQRKKFGYRLNAVEQDIVSNSFLSHMRVDAGIFDAGDALARWHRPSFRNVCIEEPPLFITCI